MTAPLGRPRQAPPTPLGPAPALPVDDRLNPRDSVVVAFARREFTRRRESLKNIDLFFPPSAFMFKDDHDPGFGAARR